MSTAVPSYQQGVKALREQLAGMLPAPQLAVFHADADQQGVDISRDLRVKVGDTAPLFSLPDANGNAVALADLLQQGKVVLTFYRGVWCPYCNLELRNLQAILPQIHAAGATVVAVSAMKPDFSAATQSQNELTFTVLSDMDTAVASQYTTVIQNPQTSTQAMADLGYDFYAFYDNQSGNLPVPATFVIDQQGKIIFAESKGGDYRERVEPQAILDALA